MKLMKNLSTLKLKTQNLSILYIENDQVLQNKLNQYFDEMFAKTYQAFNTEEGLSQYKKVLPDVVITTLRSSPTLNAFDMILKIKDIQKNAKIIVLSHINDDYKLLQSFDIGLLGLLSKPLDVTKLNNALNKLPTPKLKPAKIDKIQKKILKPILKSQESKKLEVINDKIIKKEPLKPEIIISKLTKSETLVIDAITTGKEVICINNYHGLIIHSKEKIYSYENNRLKIKFDKTQLIAITHEKKVVINVDNLLILFKLVRVEKNQNIVILSNPILLDHAPRDLQNKRLHLDSSFKSSINYRGNHKEVAAFNISMQYLALKIDVPTDLQINETVELTIGFDLNAPSSLVSEKKFTKIFAKAIVQRIETFETYQKIVLKTTISKSGENIFKKYLKQREIEIINEFKMKL